MNSGTAVLRKVDVKSGTVITTKTMMAGSIPSSTIINKIPTGFVGAVQWGGRFVVACVVVGGIFLFLLFDFLAVADVTRRGVGRATKHSRLNSFTPGFTRLGSSILFNRV